MSTPNLETQLRTAKCFDGFSENFLYLFSNIIIIYKKKKKAEMKLKAVLYAPHMRILGLLTE